MITDSDRREVARRLRELNLGGGSKDLIERTLSDAIGAWSESGMSWDFITERLADLADLIEPSEPSGHECVPGECSLNVRHDSDFIDRDALLAVADEMQRELDECVSDHEIVGNLQYHIDRILEALNVTVEVER